MQGKRKPSQREVAKLKSTEASIDSSPSTSQDVKLDQILDILKRLSVLLEDETLEPEHLEGIAGAAESLLPLLGTVGKTLFPAASPLIGLAEEFLPKLLRQL